MDVVRSNYDPPSGSLYHPTADDSPTTARKIELKKTFDQKMKAWGLKHTKRRRDMIKHTLKTLDPHKKGRVSREKVFEHFNARATGGFGVKNKGEVEINKDLALRLNFNEADYCYTTEIKKILY